MAVQGSIQLAGAPGLGQDGGLQTLDEPVSATIVRAHTPAAPVLDALMAKKRLGGVLRRCRLPPSGCTLRVFCSTVAM